MYKFPICKHHSNECSKIAREALEPLATAPKKDYSSIPTDDNVKTYRKTLSGF